MRLDGSWFEVIGPDGPLASGGASGLTDDVLLEEEIVSVVLGVLGLVQQEVAEETIEPWPARSGKDYRGFPEPHAEITATSCACGSEIARSQR